MDNGPKLQMTPFVVKGRRETFQGIQEKQERREAFQGVPEPREKKPARERLSSPARRRSRAEQEDNQKTFRILAKLGTCVGICALMLALKAIDTPLTQGFVQGVKTTITAETNVDDMLGKLKFVEVSEEASQVFDPDMTFVAPVTGVQKGKFGEGGRQGVELQAQPGTNVVACADGVVMAVGVDDKMGNYVRLQHAKKLETYCFGIAGVCVEEGQPLKMGDLLGRVQENGIINVEMHVNGRPRDPQTLFERAAKQ